MKNRTETSDQNFLTVRQLCSRWRTTTTSLRRIRKRLGVPAVRLGPSDNCRLLFKVADIEAIERRVTIKLEEHP